METFRSLFGKLLVFVYHCFDRIVIQGHLPLLSREGHIVFFFRDVRGEYPITPKVLQQRTNAYRAWVDAYAGNHKIPVEKAKKGVSKEEHVRPYLERMERQNRYGVYFIFKSMEQGSCGDLPSISDFLLRERASLHGKRTETGQGGVPQERQRVSMGGRSRGAASCR